VRTGSIGETRGIFGDKFPGRGIPAKRAIQTLVKKWRSTGSVHNAPKQTAPAVRTPEVIEDIRRRITHSPKKSTRKLAQQTHVSRRMPTCVKESTLEAISCDGCASLKKADKPKQVNHCTWLLNSIGAGLLDPCQYLMSDEAWFHLSGHENSQKTRYWAAENPHLLHERPPHDQKIGVCCAMSLDRYFLTVPSTWKST
jgi:hypothetical protein